MAFSIQVPGSDFTYSLGSLTLPDRTGLVGEFVIGGNDADSIRNRAAPALADATVINTPAYSDVYATVGSNTIGGFDTNVQIPLNATLIFVARKLTGIPPLLGASGLNGFINYGGAISLYNQQSGTLSIAADVPIPSHSDFFFAAGMMPIGQKASIRIYEGGVVTENIAEAAGNSGSRTVDTLRIGNKDFTGGDGTADIAYAAIFDRVLTATEVEAAYLSLKSYMASVRKLTVS